MITFNVDEKSFDPNDIQEWDVRCREASKNIILHKLDHGLMTIPKELSEIEPNDAMGKANAIYQWFDKGEGKTLIEAQMMDVSICPNKTFTYNDIFKTPFSEFQQTNKLQ